MSSIAVDGITTPSHRFLSRLLGGALIGFIAGAIAIAAIQLGVAYDYAAEDPRHTWGMFFWGNHPVIRVIASGLATLLASWLAGLVARRAGSIAAFLAALPSIVGWAYCAVAAWTGSFAIAGHAVPFEATVPDKAISVLLAIGSIPLAFLVGRAGGTVGERFAPFFDSRRHCVLGLRWYHYLWLPLPLYLLVILNSWAVFYFLSLQLAAWNADSYAAIVPGLLSIGLVASSMVTYEGLARAYRVLSRRDNSTRPAVAVLKYGCGFPLLGSLMQTALNLAHIGLDHLWSWIAR